MWPHRSNWSLDHYFCFAVLILLFDSKEPTRFYIFETSKVSDAKRTVIIWWNQTKGIQFFWNLFAPPDQRCFELFFVDQFVLVGMAILKRWRRKISFYFSYYFNDKRFVRIVYPTRRWNDKNSSILKLLRQYFYNYRCKGSHILFDHFEKILKFASSGYSRFRKRSIIIQCKYHFRRVRVWIDAHCKWDVAFNLIEGSPVLQFEMEDTLHEWKGFRSPPKVIDAVESPKRIR